MKMVYYELIKVIIDALGLAKVILDVVVWHYDLPNSIMSDRGLLFTSKFWSSLCYFLGIKQKLSTTFHPQTDGQTQQQNSMIETYFQTFINFEQNDLTRLPPMAEFAYNNANNASTGYTPFKLNYSYHLHMFYKKHINPHSKLKLVEQLLSEPQTLMLVCYKNLHHTQQFQKQAHNRGTKPKSYAPGDKVLLNNKYIKTKQNQKLKT